MTIVVAGELGAVSLPPQPGASYVTDRRRRRVRPYLRHDRRRLTAPRLERRDGLLAVVRTCPDCGRVSVVPWSPGGAAAFVCDCAGIAARPQASRRSTIVAWSLALLWLLNVADLVLTHRALTDGAIEANALMNVFLRLGFLWGGAFKIGLVTAGVLFLWHERRRPLVYPAALLLALVYTLLIVYQVVGLTVIA